MKKIIAILSTAALVFAVAGCASTKGTTNKADAKAEEAPKYVEPTLPTTEMTVLDNFADGNYWEAVGSTWDDVASDKHNMVSTCDLSSDTVKGWPTAGATTSLKCDSSEPAAGNTSTAFWMCNAPALTDWTGYRHIAIDVYNPNDFDLQLCWVLQTTDSWVWKQTPAINVPKGVHTVLFNFKDLGYGTDADIDTNIAAVKRMLFANFGEVANTFYIGNFRLYK